MEEDDRMRGEPDVPGQVRLAEVLMGDIIDTGDRVETQPSFVYLFRAGP